jgi:ribose 5-phosphate isomerase B
MRSSDPNVPRATPSHASRAVVTAEDLAPYARGAVVRVPSAARLTPLAADLAAERGLVLVPGGGGAVAVGCDHGGFEMKLLAIEHLRALGRDVVDVGTHSADPVDYPDFAFAVARAVASGDVALGIVIDAAGIGSAIAANKVPGVRAAAC